MSGGGRLLVAALPLGPASVWACGESTKAREVARVVVSSPIGARLGVGRTAQLAASARDASGATIAGVSVNWSSSAPAIATVSGTGLVAGVAEGAVTITAKDREIADLRTRLERLEASLRQRERDRGPRGRPAVPAASLDVLMRAA